MSSALFEPRLLEFNLLPSRQLHPSWLARLQIPALAVPQALQVFWHKHWSRAILQQLDLYERPVLDADLPQLPLALLAPGQLARLAALLGLLAAAEDIRRSIAGSQVRQMLAGLGPEALDFARQKAGLISPGKLPSGASLSLEQCEQHGLALLRAVFASAAPELARRAELRLPADAPQPLAAAGDAALAAALGLLPFLDTTPWLSSSLAAR